MLFLTSISRASSSMIHGEGTGPGVNSGLEKSDQAGSNLAAPLITAVMRYRVTMNRYRD